MPLVIAQVSTALDSVLARDRIVNTLHFNVQSLIGDADWDDLATDLNALWRANWGRPVGAQEIAVRLYDMDQAKPRTPKSEVITGTGLAPAATCPREVALCLSFYSGTNRARNRGRVYLSPAARGLSGLGARPTTQNLTDATALATALGDLGGANVDWCVYSTMDNQHKPVSAAWADDEWDTQRRRGLRSTTRTTVALSE